MRNSLNQAEQWHDEQVVEVLYGNVKGAILGSTLNIALVSFVLWTIFPTYGLFIWFIFGQLLNLFRLYISILYNRDKTKFQTCSWLNIHRALTCISGSLYGILAFFFFSSEHPLHQILVILLAGGMGAAAVGTHSVDRITYQSFLYSAVVPLIIRSYLEGTEVHMIVSAMLCLLMLIMLRAAAQSRQIMIDNIYMSQTLRYRATHDSLVDLLNREEFQREYNRLLQNTKNSHSTYSMIFIDLDNFKLLNDNFGHQAGDEALVEVSNIIRSSIRQDDIAARFGGDEFMILIKSESVEQASLVADKIMMRVLQFQENHLEEDIMFGASIGIGYTQNKACSFENLLRAADKACYQAKNDGKGKICLEKENDSLPLKIAQKNKKNRHQ